MKHVILSRPLKYFNKETSIPLSNESSFIIKNELLTQSDILNVIESNDQGSAKDVPMSIDTIEATRVRIANPKNALIGYLNINHIRNKVGDLKELTDRLSPTILGISETKLDTSFPNASLYIENYYNPGDYRKDRTCNGGGLLVYVRKGTPCKRLKVFEEPDVESICFEITIKQRKWVIFSIYRPPYDYDLHQYFNYISKMMEKA